MPPWPPYEEAMELVPDGATNGEAPFWVGITLAAGGREADALPFLQRAYAEDERWFDLVSRLPASGLLPGQAMAERLRQGMREGG